MTTQAAEQRLKRAVFPDKSLTTRPRGFYQAYYRKRPRLDMLRIRNIVSHTYTDLPVKANVNQM